MHRMIDGLSGSYQFTPKESLGGVEIKHFLVARDAKTDQGRRLIHANQHEERSCVSKVPKTSSARSPKQPTHTDLLSQLDLVLREAFARKIIKITATEIALQLHKHLIAMLSFQSTKTNPINIIRNSLEFNVKPRARPNVASTER